MTSGEQSATDGADLDHQVTGWTRPGTAPLVGEVTLLLADDIHRTWSRTDEEAPPFWAFAWAGGQALARHVLDHPDLVAGRRVLDLATGSGIVAIAAALAGAIHVVASDSDARARVAAQRNAALNGVTLDVVGDLVGDEAERSSTQQMGDEAERSSTQQMGDEAERSSTQQVGDDAEVDLDVDVVLAGDVFYEQPMARRMLEFLDEAAGVGVEVLVGDPGREYLPRRRVTPLATYDVPGTADLEGRAVTPTTVHRFV